jgi:hypothetical protein
MYNIMFYETLHLNIGLNIVKSDCIRLNIRTSLICSALAGVSVFNICNSFHS